MCALWLHFYKNKKYRIYISKSMKGYLLKCKKWSLGGGIMSSKYSFWSDREENLSISWPVHFSFFIESFSGITKKILNPVTTKLKDVQRQLKALLPPDAVLVGHSLDLDLRALKVSIWFRTFSSTCACFIYLRSSLLFSSPLVFCFGVGCYSF